MKTVDYETRYDTIERSMEYILYRPKPEEKKKHFMEGFLPEDARCMKKKMTRAEFEAWSRYAVELREQAEENVLSFGVYQQEIRK